MQQMIFIADLIACSTCFGHHYAHHQELECIMQVVSACGIWCFDQRSGEIPAYDPANYTYIKNPLNAAQKDFFIKTH